LSAVPAATPLNRRIEFATRAQHAYRLADMITAHLPRQCYVRAPATRSELARGVGLAGPRHLLLKLQQLDRGCDVPYQNALTFPRAEDHQGANVNLQIYPSHYLGECRFGSLRDGLSCKQGDVGQMMPMRFWPLRFGEPGRR